MAKVTLLSYTPEPEKTVAAAAKLCYSPAAINSLTEGLTGEESGKFVRRLAAMGHESPIEHASFTFAVEGASRSLLAQITRHRIASFSVQSQRYVAETGFEYIIPPEIEKIPQAREEFIKAMREAQDSYNRLAEILKNARFAALLEEKGLEEAGLDEKKRARLLSQAEKSAIEDARFVLPNACETKMLVTMNARSLLNFFRHRCCLRAQWEIRGLANQMLCLVSGIAPNIFAKAGPPCLYAPCPEGGMSCGKAEDVRRFYKKIPSS
ncbi:MAG: FAD-dependent thymidylate synthase [Oscillospiraceae bacterium]|jgi:thymidylate synthase (FAD)|nr:FAD-dependent thymidylate synthase [Oscillospiraceae bacterium]